MNSIYQSLVELEKTHGSAALCTVVKSEGSTPRHVGSKMLVYPDGHFIGTVGGGDLEHRVIDEAWMAIAEGQSRLLHYNMVDPSRGDPGVCGGQVEVFVEPILPDPLVVIIGAGHVGRAIVHLAKWLGFRVIVSDDRAELCNPETTPEADAYYPVRMSELPNHIKFDRRTFLILTTRGSNVDVDGLAPLLDLPAAYIGVIGSKRRWASTVKGLKAQGVSEEKLTKVHSPIGLELHAETPEEIAVSIMAEVLMIRDKGTGKQMKAGEAVISRS
ncbi:putative xanthine dehydrogenase subunit A [Anaerolineales bacterium]|nr:putative xanthine dehydrogenase subunit A [Anaerolineales bacterium]